MSRLLGVSPESNSIKVVARFRPQNSLEISQNCGECVTFKKELNEVEVRTGEDSPHKFQFDKIFSHPCRQSEVYEYTGKQIVEDVFKGYNGTIFVYGQTGSGKTFSMMGPNTSGLQGYCDDEELKGIIPRVVEDIFKAVEEADENIEFTLKVSYVEVYMERIRDLLDPKKVNLQIHEDNRSGRGIYIAEATEAYVCDPEEVFRLMQAGASNRAVASTRMNDESSRSHSIFQITVTQKHNINLEQKSGKLFLVDLAGSEKVGKTHAMGQQLEEAKLINKSLSCLGMVIHALTDPKATHIPYRDSKLTRLLQDSLGGNSRTTLMICCSPSKYNDQETLSTCRFGERAKTVKNKAKINKEWTVGELKALLEKAEREIYQLKQIKGVSDPEEESKRAQEMADLEREMQEQKKRLTDERDELVHQLTVMKEEFYQQQQLLTTLKLEKTTLQEEIELWEKEYTALHQLYQQSLYYFEREKQSNSEKSKSIDSLLKNSEDLLSYIASLKGHITKLPSTNDHPERVLKEQMTESGLRTSAVVEEGISGGGPLSLDAQQEVLKLRKENEILKQSLLSNNGAPMDLNEYNHSLLRDLQNKCERVIDLEIGLDEARESYRHLVQVSSNKNLKRQVTMLEQEAQERSDSLQDIYNENCTLRLEMQLAEKKLAIRNERIENLKSALKEEKRHYKQLQEQMAIEHEKTSGDLSLCQEELNYWKEKALSRERGVLGKGGGSKKVVKVLKGGQRTTSSSITAMLGVGGVYS